MMLLVWKSSFLHLNCPSKMPHVILSKYLHFKLQPMLSRKYPKMLYSLYTFRELFLLMFVEDNGMLGAQESKIYTDMSYLLCLIHSMLIRLFLEARLKFAKWKSCGQVSCCCWIASWQLILHHWVLLLQSSLHFEVIQSFEICKRCFLATSLLPLHSHFYDIMVIFPFFLP